MRSPCCPLLVKLMHFTDVLFFLSHSAHLWQEQASWVCRCEDRVVQRLEQDFKMTLQQQNSLEQWAAWLDGVVSQVLKPYQHSPAFSKAAKLFLLKWSFYRYDLKHVDVFNEMPSLFSVLML